MGDPHSAASKALFPASLKFRTYSEGPDSKQVWLGAFLALEDQAQDDWTEMGRADIDVLGSGREDGRYKLFVSTMSVLFGQKMEELTGVRPEMHWSDPKDTCTHPDGFKGQTPDGDAHCHHCGTFESDVETSRGEKGEEG